LPSSQILFRISSSADTELSCPILFPMDTIYFLFSEIVSSQMFAMSTFVNKKRIGCAASNLYPTAAGCFF
jgi:hypothetical protein